MLRMAEKDEARSPFSSRHRFLRRNARGRGLVPARGLDGAVDGPRPACWPRASTAPRAAARALRLHARRRRVRRCRPRIPARRSSRRRSAATTTRCCWWSSPRPSTRSSSTASRPSACRRGPSAATDTERCSRRTTWRRSAARYVDVTAAIVDPAYQQGADLERTVNRLLVEHLERAWHSARVAVWYPVRDTAKVDQLHDALRALPRVKEILAAELVRDEDDDALRACRAWEAAACPAAASCWSTRRTASTLSSRSC